MSGGGEGEGRGDGFRKVGGVGCEERTDGHELAMQLDTSRASVVIVGDGREVRTCSSFSFVRSNSFRHVSRKSTWSLKS